MSQRIVYALDLVDDAALIVEYERYHAAGAVWPEVLADIRERGILSMEIWRLADRLVMIAEVAADYPRQVRLPERPAVVNWEAIMDHYQRRILDHGPKWRIFDWEDRNSFLESHPLIS